MTQIDFISQLSIEFTIQSKADIVTCVTEMPSDTIVCVTYIDKEERLYELQLGFSQYFSMSPAFLHNKYSQNFLLYLTNIPHGNTN